ncbi:MAG: O-antigen ligase family protein [Fidelibacterota bacterium]
MEQNLENNLNHRQYTLIEKVIIGAFFFFPLTYIKLFLNYDLADLLLSIAFLLVFFYRTTTMYSLSLSQIIFSHKFMVPLILFTLGFLLSLYNAFQLIEALTAFLQVLFIFLVCYLVLAAVIADTNFLRSCLRALLVGTIIQTLVLLTYFLFNIDLSFGLYRLYGWGERYTFGGMLPNLSARLIVQVLPITFIYLVTQRPRWQKGITLFLAALIGFCVILTGSRAGLVILAFLVVTFFFFYLTTQSTTPGLSSKKLFFLIGSSLVLVLVTFLYIQYVPEHLIERILTILNPSASASSRERIDLVRQALRYLARHPFVGVGFEQFHLYTLQGRNVHNALLAAWVENGFLGFVGFGLIYLIITYHIFLAYRWKFFQNLWLLALSTLVLGNLLGDMFMTNAYRRIFWVPALLLVFAFHQIKNKAQQPELKNLN